MQTGIKSFGAYLPMRRMSRAAMAEAHAWAFPSLKSLEDKVAINGVCAKSIVRIEAL
jgi:hypothetical protein